MLNNIHLWIGEYLWQRVMRGPFPRLPAGTPVHIIFSIVDHFEPRQGSVAQGKEVERTELHRAGCRSRV